MVVREELLKWVQFWKRAHVHNDHIGRRWGEKEVFESCNDPASTLPWLISTMSINQFLALPNLHTCHEWQESYFSEFWGFECVCVPSLSKASELHVCCHCSLAPINQIFRLNPLDVPNRPWVNTWNHFWSSYCMPVLLPGQRGRVSPDVPTVCWCLEISFAC
jgi:hypothetical protein